MPQRFQVGDQVCHFRRPVFTGIVQTVGIHGDATFDAEYIVVPDTPIEDSWEDEDGNVIPEIHYEYYCMDSDLEPYGNSMKKKEVKKTGFSSFILEKGL
jgi:hypothetical protein